MIEIARYFYNREKLQRMPSHKLFDLHGSLNMRHAERAFKTWKHVKHQEYPIGSFLISVVETNRRFLQIHFAPFGLTDMSFDHEGTAIKSLILGLADSERMFDMVAELSQRHQIKEISGETNYVMANLAVEMGLQARNHKVNHYSNIVSTLDIQQFLSTARQKIAERRQHYQERIDKSGISVDSARIDAIIKLLS